MLRAYATPRVTRFGTMKSLTQGASGSEAGESTPDTDGDPVQLVSDPLADVNDFNTQINVAVNNDVVKVDSDSINANGRFDFYTNDADVVVNINTVPIDTTDADPFVVLADPDGDAL